jgi:hypothetical protein
LLSSRTKFGFFSSPGSITLPTTKVFVTVPVFAVRYAYVAPTASATMSTSAIAAVKVFFFM